MPGQLTLDPKYYPSDFNVTSVALSGYGFGTAGLSTQIPLLYADRDMVIDSVTLVCPLHSATPLTGLVLKKTTAPAPAVTGSTNVATNTLARAANATAAVLSFTIDKTNNQLRSGEILSLFATAFSATAGEQIFVQIRWRSQF